MQGWIRLGMPVPSEEPPRKVCQAYTLAVMRGEGSQGTVIRVVCHECRAEADLGWILRIGGLLDGDVEAARDAVLWMRSHSKLSGLALETVDAVFNRERRTGTVQAWVTRVMNGTQQVPPVPVEAILIQTGFRMLPIPGNRPER